MRSAAVAAIVLAATVLAAQPGPPESSADLILFGRVYTQVWSNPSLMGAPVPAAPVTDGQWHPDAEAVAVRDGRIVYYGSASGAHAFRGPRTEAIILPASATIVPGLVDAHVHLFELGASLERVNLVGVKTEADVVERVVARAATTPKGEWIVGWGWDEGDWANRYPDMTLLSRRVPDHPVYLRGLHSFAGWGNRLAFERAAITADTVAPEGGEIRKDASGRPTGIVLNNAVRLLESAVPAPTPAQLKSRALAGLTALARAGYVTVHEAGADSAQMDALQSLAAEGRLPIRVYAMLAARDQALLDRWLIRGPDRDNSSMLVTRSVKAFYDGALGSRGALLAEDYADRPGHRGQRDQTFEADRLTPMIKAGFQIAVHAIGDAANTQVLDFFENAARAIPGSASARHRIEHAQVVARADITRFAALGIIASMQPSHAVEDMPWAGARLGPLRVEGSYAWRTLRQAGARLVFSSDLPGTDYDFFYGLHSAVTRQDREGTPAGGWRQEERVTVEEALRGATQWAAYAAFREDATGVIFTGRWADLTVLSLDPFTTPPLRLLAGKATMTIVGGKIVAR